MKIIILITSFLVSLLVFSLFFMSEPKYISEISRFKEGTKEYNEDLKNAYSELIKEEKRIQSLPDKEKAKVIFDIEKRSLHLAKLTALEAKIKLLNSNLSNFQLLIAKFLGALSVIIMSPIFYIIWVIMYVSFDYFKTKQDSLSNDTLS